MSFAAKRLPITTLTLVFILVAPIVAVAQATLRGKVVEHSTGQPIGYVTISLFRSGDTTQRASAGALSLPDGSFVIRSVREGLYRLRVRMIGYAVVERDSIAVPSSGTVTLGTISLRQEAIEQRAVEVRAERELQESRPDRRIYRVGKDLTVAGGTAADALQNVPGVTVDQDRSIQLRGSSNVVVLLDGKPTALTGGDRSGGTGLDNIPADAIEAIEIVTTPDARYDAEGGAGIVNIILKRQRQQPLTAFGTVTVGTRDKYSGFASIGVQTSALRGEGSYGWTRQTFDFDRYSLLVPHVETAGPDYPGRVTGSRPVRSETHTPRLNLDADLFDGAGRMTVTVGGTFQQQRTVSDASYVYLLRQQNGTDPVLSGRTEYRTMYRGDTTTGIEASVGYRHRFDDQWSLSTDARTLQTRTVAGAFGTMLVLSDGIAATNRMGSSQMIQQHSLQADATYRFPNRGQFDVGAKITWRHLDADQRTVADSTDPLAAVLTVAVSGAVAERIAAAYVQTMLPIGVLQLSAGLRAEATDFRSSIGSVDFRQSYWNLFPSLNAMYSPDPLLRLSLRYSRRISRPSNEALSPLVQQDDPYNLRTGTPALQPELVDALELGATAVLPWATIAPTFYWRSHQNVLGRYRTFDSVRSVTQLVFANWDRMDVGGVEVLVQGPVTSWWRMTLTGSLAYQQIAAGSVQAGLSNTGWTATLNWQNAFAIGDGWSAQVGYNLRRIGPIAQGTIGTIRAGEVAIRYEFLDGKASLAFRLSDPLDERVFTIAMRTAAFDQDLRFKRESRIAYLTVSYLFGTGDRPMKDGEIRPPSDDL